MAFSEARRQGFSQRERERREGEREREGGNRRGEGGGDMVDKV